MRIWYRNGGRGVAAFIDTRGPVWIHDAEPLLHESPQQVSVAIRPITPQFGILAVAFVPPELEVRAALNGVPLWTGFQGLRHADRLDIHGHSIWFAAKRAVEPCVYDPAVHGMDVFCTITKARLSPGESIVVCPGTECVACQAIYRQEAWEMAMSATSELRCPMCKFRPDDAAWTPPSTAQPKPQIRSLFEVAAHDCR